MLNYFSYNVYEAICEAIAARTEDNKSMTEVAAIVRNCLERNDKIPIKIYCESPDYLPPEYAHPGEDACMDLRARWIEKRADRVICHTGIHIELPKGCQLNIYPRSSNVNTGWYIPNTPGIGDSGYRGEIKVVFRHPHGMDREEFPFKEGERCAQCQVVYAPEVDWKRVPFLKDLSQSKRGEGGYGSTGKH